MTLSSHQWSFSLEHRAMNGRALSDRTLNDRTGLRESHAKHYGIVVW
jgi:hypothetical protein